MIKEMYRQVAPTMIVGSKGDDQGDVTRLVVTGIPRVKFKWTKGEGRTE